MCVCLFVYETEHVHVRDLSDSSYDLVSIHYVIFGRKIY